MTEGRIGAGAGTAAFAADDIRTGLKRLTPALLVVGLWLAFHPYTGIVHDSRLYVAQALNAIQPDIFGRDLFFLFGSQDSFTLFTPLFAPLVHAVGPLAASLVMVAFSHALWLAGAAALALRLAPGRTAAIAGLVVLAAVPGFYGGWQLVDIGEGFATPRPLVEALTFWALWALTGPDRRKGLILAAALSLVAAMLHPIMALAPLGTGFVYLMLGDRRWAWLGLAGLGTVLAAALAGLAPFDRLLQTMDAEWRGLIESRNVFLFPSLWKATDWGRTVLAAMTVLAAAGVLDGWRRRLLLAGLIASLGGLAVTCVGADMFSNLLLIQLQTWRMLWLLQAFACLGGGFLLYRLWQLRADGFALVAMVVGAWLVCLTLQPAFGTALSAIALFIAVARLKGRLGPLPLPARIICVSLTALVVAVLATYRVVTLTKWVSVADGWAAFMDAFGYLTIIELAVAAAIVLPLLRFAPDTARRVLPVAALILAVAAGTAWDRRDGWSRTVTAEPPAAFQQWLAPDAQVYWEGAVRGAWLLLERPSYVSMAQGAGIVFARDTAITFRDRVRVVEGLTGRDLIDAHRAYDHTAPPPLPVLDRARLAAACRADDALDAMVLSREVPGAWTAQWSPPAPVFDTGATRKGVSRPPIHTFYLYLCGELH